METWHKSKVPFRIRWTCHCNEMGLSQVPNQILHSSTYGSIVDICTQAMNLPTTGILLGSFLVTWPLTFMQDSLQWQYGCLSHRIGKMVQAELKHLKTKRFTNENLLCEHLTHAVNGTRLSWPEGIHVSSMKICKKDICLVFLKGRASLDPGWKFVLKLQTFQQLEYFLVASWQPGLWLSCRTYSNGSMDAWVIGSGKWSRWLKHLKTKCFTNKNDHDSSRI
jgi:hypothetical protein